MIPEAAAARDRFVQVKNQFLATFARIPEDRQTWTPAPTARTPVQIVAHCAEAIRNLDQMIQGIAFEPQTTKEADRGFREHEAGFTSAGPALQLFEENSAHLIATFERLTADDLERPFVAPFGMGEFPMASSLDFPADHTRSHISQLEYIQTIIGDRDWGF